MKPKPMFEYDGTAYYKYEDIKDFILWWSDFVDQKPRFDHLSGKLEPVEEWELDMYDRPLTLVGYIEIPSREFYASVGDFFDAFYELGGNHAR